MKERSINKKSLAKKLAVGALTLGLMFAPTAAFAASNTASTTVNAVIASVISISSSGTVTLNITPVSGGAQTSASDTVTVSTNNAAGYNLTLADSDATTNLVNGANTIAASANTYASPAALTNNSWGYAVGGLGGFDASYSVISNASSSTTKWAGVPASGSPQNIRSTSATASGEVTTVWYSAKADTTKPNGTYADIVTYTATTK